MYLEHDAHLLAHGHLRVARQKRAVGGDIFEEECSYVPIFGQNDRTPHDPSALSLAAFHDAISSVH